ncbi:MAG: hypothetical protein WCT08_00125 [Patescibacteria group bacterium]|jgi:hypothetical protein
MSDFGFLIVSDKPFIWRLLYAFGTVGFVLWLAVTLPSTPTPPPVESHPVAKQMLEKISKAEVGYISTRPDLTMWEAFFGTNKDIHNCYWGSGKTASASNPDGFKDIGITIPEMDIYTYAITVATKESLLVTATHKDSANIILAINQYGCLTKQRLEPLSSLP